MMRREAILSGAVEARCAMRIVAEDLSPLRVRWNLLAASPTV
jgi:hypothetical protein